MIDFLMSPTGDIIFSEVDNAPKRLAINFFKSNSNILKIDFDIENYGEYVPSDKSLKITFDLENIKNNKRVDLIEGDAAIIQQILLRLKTSLRELPEREEIGSMLETVMHKDISDIAVRQRIEKIIADAIKDLITNYSVKVVPRIDRSEGYEQCVDAYIYRDDSLLLREGLEW